MNNHRKERSFRAFLSKNGFYIALVVCVIIAAVASYSAVSNILGNLKDENSVVQQSPESNPPVSAQPETPPVVKDDEDEDKSATADNGLIPIYSMPVDGTVTTEFSGDELVKNETMNDWRTHNGVDIEAPEGTQVRAVYAGEILHAGVDPLLGNYVEQKLDTGYTVVYANLGPITGIKAGDRISQGDAVGTIGSSAILENGTLPHLHFEVKSGDRYINPLSIFDDNGR